MHNVYRTGLIFLKTTRLRIFFQDTERSRKSIWNQRIPLTSSNLVFVKLSYFSMNTFHLFYCPCIIYTLIGSSKKDTSSAIPVTVMKNVFNLSTVNFNVLSNPGSSSEMGRKNFYFTGHYDRICTYSIQPLILKTRLGVSGKCQSPKRI